MPSYLLPQIIKGVVDNASARREAAEQVEWPLKAKVWKRESTQEWVLEIKGNIGGSNVTCRHTEPLTTELASVPGLPSRYATKRRK